jgi:magnesium-transporting ATPase (P-type)
LRDGQEVEINVNQIKVGDVLKIKGGMDIPCDGLVLRSSGVSCDESAMTGESVELKKESLDHCNSRIEEKKEEEKFQKESMHTSHDIPSPILLSGTQIQTGEGWFLVLMVGKNSCVGKIKSKLAQKIEMTPLQQKLEAIGTDIGKLGLYSAIITVLVLFVRFFVEQGIAGFNWSDDIGEYLNDWFRYIIIGVAIIVVAVPEGLPLAVMIALAYSVRKMLKDMNFVKRLQACEIMGGANNVCSDKTGTLTKNEMTVTNFWKGKIFELDPESKSYSQDQYFKNPKVFELFKQAATCNVGGNMNEATATEKAFLKVI